MRILIVKEKYGDYYYDVSDDKKLHKVCCKILKERLKDGWYGKTQDLTNFDFIKNATGMTDAEIKALPEGNIKQHAITLSEHEKIKIKYAMENNAFINQIKQCIESPYDPKAKPFKRTIAYGLLRSRKDYEYEVVTLEDVIEGK